LTKTFAGDHLRADCRHVAASVVERIGTSIVCDAPFATHESSGFASMLTHGKAAPHCHFARVRPSVSAKPLYHDNWNNADHRAGTEQVLPASAIQLSPTRGSIDAG
jgi:hypothetical protein